MKIFVTYSTPSYFKARNFAGKMAKWFGKFDKVILYSPDDIDADFKIRHADILNIKRGVGLWLWKPYFIFKALTEEAQAGDIVFYCDAASFFIRNADYIIRTMDDSNIWVSDNSFIEEQYTKEDAFQILNCTEDKYRKTNQIQAQFFCARKSEKSVSFVKEWLECASNYDLMGPDNTKLGYQNCKEFVSHRFDQSMLSLLSKKHGIKPHITPTEIDYPNKYKPYLYRNGKSIVKGEYPCCLVIQHSATIDYKKSIIIGLKILMPKIVRSSLRKIKYLVNYVRKKYA